MLKSPLLQQRHQDQPIEGVTLRIRGTTRQAVSGPDGRFRIANAPVGPVHLVADGATAKREGEWPTLGFELTPIAGAENPLPRPIYLLPLNTQASGASAIVGAEDVTLTLPEVPGFALEIKAGSVTFPDGARVGRMSVTAVNTNKIPNPPPNGMQPQFIVTIQPVAAIFDPPARLTLPNVDGYAPGAEVELFSYSHTLEEFLTVGWGTVSEDGATITSNENVGVVESGWHCGAAPGGSACCCHTDNPCKYCPAGACNPEVDEDRPTQSQQPDDCKTALCGGGSTFADESGVLKDSKDQEGDCSTPFCNSDTESPDTQNDANDLDKSGPNWECEQCENEDQVKNPAANGNQCEDECGSCDNGACQIAEEDYDKPRAAAGQAPDDCKTLLCVDPPKFSDESANLTNTAGDCKTPFCNADTKAPDEQNEPFDLPDTPDAECQICQNMAPAANPGAQGNPCDDECGICAGLSCEIDKDKVKKEQASPKDCRTDLCGGGWKADDGEEPDNICKMCSGGAPVNDPGKEGTPISPDPAPENCYSSACTNGAISDQAIWNPGDAPYDFNKNDCRVGSCVEGQGLVYEPALDQLPNDLGYCYDPACDGISASKTFNQGDTPADTSQKDCRAPSCVEDQGVAYIEAPGQTPDDPGYCRSAQCDGMTPKVIPDPNGLPEDEPNDCRIPMCTGADQSIFSLENAADGSGCQILDDPCVLASECRGGTCVATQYDTNNPECACDPTVEGANCPQNAIIVKADGNILAIDEIAYITGEPRMPVLTAELEDKTVAGNTTWVYNSTYERRAPLDDENISATKPNSQVWQINPSFIKPFHGGDGTVRASTAAEPFTFKMRGKNPEDGAVRNFINFNRFNNGYDHYYAVWIATHESRLAGGYIFNQFNEGNSLAGEPNYGYSDGWGIMQIDGDGMGRDITADEAWNWHTNVLSGIVWMSVKHYEAENFVRAARRTYGDDPQWEEPPSSYQASGMSRAIDTIDLCAIQLYNRAGHQQQLLAPDGVHTSLYNFCMKYDPTAPSGSKWTFVPNSNNYVYKVFSDPNVQE